MPSSPGTTRWHRERLRPRTESAPGMLRAGRARAPQPGSRPVRRFAGGAQASLSRRRGRRCSAAAGRTVAPPTQGPPPRPVRGRAPWLGPRRATPWPAAPAASRFARWPPPGAQRPRLPARACVGSARPKNSPAAWTTADRREGRRSFLSQLL